MATLHSMVGLPGSGKTTLARKLEVDCAALRLTVDEWHVRLFGMDVDDHSDDAAFAAHNAKHGAIESLLLEVATRVLMLGVDVILDFGFWTRRERDDLRARARELGVGFKIHFAEASERLLLERITARNSRLPPGTFHIPEARLKEWTGLLKSLRPTSSLSKAEGWRWRHMRLAWRSIASRARVIGSQLCWPAKRAPLAGEGTKD